MKKLLIGTGTVFLLLLVGYFAYQNRPRPPLETKFVQEIEPEPTRKVTITQEEIGQGRAEEVEKEIVAVEVQQPGEKALLSGTNQIYQTFNNCGPATLSMILSWYGTNVSQKELGEAMRPYQNPQGDDDDKTIFTSEFAQWVQNYGFNALSRANGDIELLKTFTANGLLVVVKTWLKIGEDIGHFRIVRGFDQKKQVIIQDDSYQGPNKRIAYFDFLSMWQPFNYNYIIVYPDGKKDLVKAILGEEFEETVAWEKVLVRAKEEEALSPENIYPVFNQAVANYHLGKFQASVDAFERVESRLPRRMLWYQIEPIRAYFELGNFERVFEVTDQVLNNGNRAFSELYLIRGNIYLQQGEKEKAIKEFKQAVFYNQNLPEAKQVLDQVLSQ